MQSFRPIKISLEDKLYSRIIRHGETRCFRCSMVRPLQTAHIMSRTYKVTRWQLRPISNAIPLCAPCHSWFDSSKDDTPIFKPEGREYFTPEKNAYAFLVEDCGYTWEDLAKLYYLSHQTMRKTYHTDILEVRRQLKNVLEALNGKTSKLWLVD